MNYEYPKNQQELAILAEKNRQVIVGMAHRGNLLENTIASTALYLKDNCIQDAVIGVSGGVDSAVALAILCEIKKRQPLHIHAEVITFKLYNKVFDNWYIDTMWDHYGESVNWNQYDLTETFNTLERQMNPNWDAFERFTFTDMRPPYTSAVAANVTYALRYQALFARAQMVRGVTIGTTNKDELDYTGWFGKNSDMMVDIQFLWRFPKCVIRDFAARLGVPKPIIARDPVGDLIDASTDEENFGCTYDELRWYIDVGRTHLTVARGEHTPFMYEKFAKLERLHQSNAHKYATKKITSYNPIFIGA